MLGKGRQRHSGKAQPQATTVEPLDRLLGGGLFPGQMVELIGRRSSGRFATALQALAAATQRGEAAALVDLGDHLDPRAAQAAGVDLERLLWLRPRRLKEALGGTEMLLATGFSLVVLDLGQPPVAGGRGVEAFWLRLARATRAREAALLVSSPYRMSGTAAAAVLEAQGQRGLWRGHADLLAGLGTRLSLAKVKGFSGGLSGDSAEGASLRRAGAQAAQVWRSPELPPGAPLPGRPDRMPRQQPQRFSSPQPWLARTG